MLEQSFNTLREINYHQCEVYCFKISTAILFPGGSDDLPAKQETWVRSLGWEDPLEERMATRSSILAWRIP